MSKENIIVETTTDKIFTVNITPGKDNISVNDALCLIRDAVSKELKKEVELVILEFGIITLNIVGDCTQLGRFDEIKFHNFYNCFKVKFRLQA
jgi:hypothetical protein